MRYLVRVEQALDAHFVITDIDLSVDIELMLHAHSRVFLRIDRATCLHSLLELENRVSDLHAPECQRCGNLLQRNRNTGRRGIRALNEGLFTRTCAAESAHVFRLNERRNLIGDRDIVAQVDIPAICEIRDRFINTSIQALKLTDQECAGSGNCFSVSKTSWHFLLLLDIECDFGQARVILGAHKHAVRNCSCALGLSGRNALVCGV